jgi:hypothetical protein
MRYLTFACASLVVVAFAACNSGTGSGDILGPGPDTGEHPGPFGNENPSSGGGSNPLDPCKLAGADGNGISGCSTDPSSATGSAATSGGGGPCITCAQAFVSMPPPKPPVASMCASATSPYTTLYDCACEGACADACAGSLCVGGAASISTPCQDCVTQACSAAITACESN